MPIVYHCRKEDENDPPAGETRLPEERPSTSGHHPPPWTDLTHLSLSSIGDRAEIRDSLTLPMLCCCFTHSCDLIREPPEQPHRTQFYKPLLDLEGGEFNVTLTIDSHEGTKGRTTAELMGQLREMLGVEEPLHYHIETPPQSPAIGQTQIIKAEPAEEMVENHVEERMNATQLHNGQMQPKEEGGDEREFTPVNNIEEKTVSLDDFKRPREQVFRVADLPSVAADAKGASAAARGEFKWKGHWWMVCDSALVNSFQLPHDEVRQVCLLQSSLPSPTRLVEIKA